MQTYLKWLVLSVLCLLSLTAQAQQRNAGMIVGGGAVTPGKRVALVIGNNVYKAENDLQPLKNPVNDAEDIGAVLKGFGFEVDIITNLDRIQMLEAIEQFRLKAGGAKLRYSFSRGMGNRKKTKTI